MNKRRNFLKDSRVKLLLALLTVLVITGSVFYYSRYHKSKTSNTPQEDRSAENGTYINYEPATEQEKTEGERIKQEGTAPSPTNNGGETQATPIITRATQDEVRAFVSNVAEDNGTCTATFKQGSFSFTKQSSGFLNVSTTNCGTIKIERSEFATTGTWSVTVSYSSKEASGVSQPSTFEVH